jgi:hypothetical protein
VPRVAYAFPWLAAAQLAISAAGAFTRSDSGMGAFLGALKDLSEENIRLSQELLKQVGEVQRQLANMPAIIAEAFISNNEFIIRERLQSCVDDMKLVTVGAPTTAADRVRLEAIVRTCQELASKRYLPYGKRGVASTCAPLAAALDAHARKLLGREDEIPKALSLLYVDWLDQVLDPKSADSLFGLMAAQGRAINQVVLDQAAKLRAESPALADLTSSAIATGINTSAAGDIDCGSTPDYKARFQSCNTLLYNGDQDAYLACMGEGATRYVRLGGEVRNTQVPIDPNSPSKLKPNLTLEVAVDLPTACASPKLVPDNQSVTDWAAQRREAILKTFAATVQPIDTARAALQALYFLYQEATEARKVLIRRIKLGV